MRSLEILLLLAEALTLLAPSVPRWRGTPWLRHMATVAVLVGTPQIPGRRPALAMPAFALNRLAALNHADPAGILTGKLDLQRVGAFGISLGGIVSG